MTGAVPADDASPAGVRDVKSAVRTVEVLEFLAGRQNRPARLREISEALQVPKSSLYALLRTLGKQGWVRTDASGTLYGIGIRALLAGTSYLDTDPYVRLAQQHLDTLRATVEETVHFGRLEGASIVYLATKESGHAHRPYSRVGRQLPAYSTALGKALLAERGADELPRHLPPDLRPLTEHTLTSRELLLADLAEVRERGYAVDRQENTPGVRCFGFALRYATPAVDAISCSVPLSRLTPEHEEQIVRAMADVRTVLERTAPRAGDGLL
ncbi:transcriptional regulator, IclR family [Geodermatophilus obscurus]|uniref:Glycerol operon regulatory protein n=1 Tax=Geodermatophilus obscurus TaxID=1861 RepID=A0A1I5CYU5_9ACTN|nr:IclR family transcriptional regulator [Geodermatophilus obscurus]SFN91821.1 transcriptional regulator, IclR family [Geodermatophilus obscurus]